MWSPILKMLPACILGLSVLGAAMPSVPRDWIYPVHPTDADLVAKGQCYSYLEDQEYNITASLLPCIEKCPGTETVECVPPANITLWNSTVPNWIFSDHNASLWEIGNCVCNYATKKVIPDLTAIGYDISHPAQSDPAFNSVQVGYGGWNIDLIGMPIGASQADTVLIQAAYNKGNPSNPSHPGDLNPKKVPMRDIVVSLWQYYTGRSVSGLSKFKYWEVQERSMVQAVPRAYAAMGKRLDDQEREGGVLIVTRKGKAKGEADAYKILRDTDFAHGLKKLTQEYAEFNKKNINSFTIQWSFGSMDLIIELTS